jgi:four helix bundle protein
MYFDFEKLDVYRVSLEFVATADRVAKGLPTGRSYLRDQLRRAANSIAANIAEGVGEFSSAEKARFFRMARRSAVECASHLLVAERLGLVEPEGVSEGREQLLRIVAMLTSMVKAKLSEGA